VPRKDIETIILEHESATAYKTFVEPYFDQRTFVEIFAGMINSKLIMSDSLLRFETIGRLVTDGIHELNTLSYRVSFNGEIDIIEKNKKSNEVTRDGRIPKFKVVSDECAEEIRGATDHTQNVFVFALRKGLATLTICNSCASTICCDACGHPVVLYESKTSNKRMFVCNVCKTEKDPDTRCAYCSGWDLVPIGIGTDTVYEELKRRFPNTEIMKLDKEVAKNTKQAEEIISKFENTKGSILVGTEMALLYMKEQVALSVVASFDSLWSIPNYKISEKVLQIVLSLVEKTEDKIIIETKNTTNKAIQAIRSMHLASFIREELREREVFGYPPYRRFIKISVTGNKRETSIHKKILSDLFKDYEPHLFGGRNKTQKDEYTTHCLLKLKTSLWSVSQLSPFGEIDEGLKAKLKGLPKPFNITVDPEDFL
jgi:primosomal protein N' (replication factor Y)